MKNYREERNTEPTYSKSVANDVKQEVEYCVESEKREIPIDSTITSERIKTANEFLNLMDRLRSIKWKDLFNGITKFLTLVIVALVIAFAFNPKPFIEHYLDIQSSIQTEQHMDLIDKRVQNTPYINACLDALRIEAGVFFNRASILEFHNGNNNIAGLPFYWSDMTYESTDSDIIGVRDNWNSISLTRYNFSNQFFNDGYFVGSTLDIERIDKRFAFKLREDDITYIAALPILDSSGRTIGAIVMSSDTKEQTYIDKAEVLKILHHYEAKLKPLLLGK